MTENAHISNEMQAAHETMIANGRAHTATIDRLIGNIPAACKMLLEEGHVSLVDQLERDRNNLIYWQEHSSPRLTTKEASRKARRAQLNATCPSCRTDVLNELEEAAHDWTGYGPPASRVIECPKCKKEIGFGLAWSMTLYWAMPTGRQAKPIVEEPAITDVAYGARFVEARDD